MKVVEPMVTTFGGIWASMGYCNFQTLEYMHERVVGIQGWLGSGWTCFYCGLTLSKDKGEWLCAVWRRRSNEGGKQRWGGESVLKFLEREMLHCPQGSDMSTKERWGMWLIDNPISSIQWLRRIRKECRLGVGRWDSYDCNIYWKKTCILTIVILHKQEEQILLSKLSMLSLQHHPQKGVHRSERLSQ